MLLLLLLLLLMLLSLWPLLLLSLLLLPLLRPRLRIAAGRRLNLLLNRLLSDVVRLGTTTADGDSVDDPGGGSD